MLNKKHTTGLDTTRRGKKVQSNENPDLSCKRERESTHYMTPFIDSASVCLVIQKNKTTTTTGFGKLNSVLTRNQPLSSSTWTNRRTQFSRQNHHYSTFVEHCLDAIL